MKSLILSAAALALAAALPAQANEALAKKHMCTTCHVIKGAKTIGPAYADVAKKYAGGQVPMPPNAAVPDADIKTLVKWVLSIK